jgi:hypothetical protein
MHPPRLSYARLLLSMLVTALTGPWSGPATASDTAGASDRSGAAPDAANVPASASTSGETAAPPQAAAARRAVFVCEIDGAPVYADRPCTASAVPRWLVVDRPAAGAVGSIAPRPPAATVLPRRLPARETDVASRTTDARCDRLRHRLGVIDDAMRAGYSAREAARLWQRWRDAKEQLREARC